VVVEEEVVVDAEEEDSVAVVVIITAEGDITVEEVIIAVIMDHADFTDLFMVIMAFIMDLHRQHPKMLLPF